MEKFLTLCLLCTNFALSAQNLPNAYFNQYETIPCPFDSSKTINAYVDWVIYQTLDGTWSGPIDSSRCITLDAITGHGIDLQGADLTKPLFVRCKLTEDNKVWLEPDKLYNVGTALSSYFNSTELIGGIGCAENLCSGLIIGVQVPDSTGTTTAMRWHTDIVPTATVILPTNIATDQFVTCIPTEYFNENYVREYIVKMTLASSVMPDNKIRMDYNFFDQRNPNLVLDEMIAPQFTFVDTSYEVPISYVSDQANGWDYIYMLPYNDEPNWPSSAHPSYAEGRPQVNTPDPKVINIIVDGDSEFVPQPFAFMRGALVEGSDSIRHQVNLVNHGGDICMGGDLVDFVFDEGTKYVHQGGHVNFEGRSACMMFKNGGALEVGDGATFQYGQEGKGIMALRPGSTFRLGRGSTLLMENLLWLQGVPTAKYPDPQIYMNLPLGSSLVFGEHANIYNGMSVSDTKLNVYMNGGTLDDSKLSPASRQLINRIYPKPKADFSDNVKLLQNPVQDLLTLGYVSGGAESVLVEVFDMQGKKMGEQKFEVNEGFNTLNYGVSGVATGIYLASVSTKSGRAIVKVTKQ